MGDIVKRMMDAEADANDDISAKRFDGTFTPGQSDRQINRYESNNRSIDESKSAMEILKSNESSTPEIKSCEDIRKELLQRALERERRLKESKQQNNHTYKSDFDYSKSRLAGGSYKEYEFDSADQKQRDKILGKKDLDSVSEDNQNEDNRSVNKSSKIEESDSLRFRKRPTRRSERIAERNGSINKYNTEHSRQENNTFNKNYLKKPHFQEPKNRGYDPYA